MSNSSLDTKDVGEPKKASDIKDKIYDGTYCTHIKHSLCISRCSRSMMIGRLSFAGRETANGRQRQKFWYKKAVKKICPSLFKLPCYISGATELKTTGTITLENGVMFE